MRRVFLTSLLSAMGLLLVQLAPVQAQGETAAADSLPPLTLFTDFPSQADGIGENVTLNLKLSGTRADIVQLDVRDLPEGWTATFKGGSHLVNAVYV